MSEQFIDLRSDTVTCPTAPMREAMASAPVGDDVHDEDPTIHELQEYVADLLGKEAAIYVPSGTMSNQIALNIHTNPGDEVIGEESCHIFNYEAGGPARLSHLMCRMLKGDHGILNRGDFEGKLRPDDEHYVRSRLVILENTHNRGGGRVYPIQNIMEICDWARSHGLATHLDGARLMNAAIASEVPAAQISSHFDTVSVCFSKGLGAPVGSALVGSAAMIDKARRFRKLLGGGMRQAGIIAAGALYAVQNNIERLREDHAHARLLADTIRDTPGLRLVPPEVDTNLVWFEVDSACGTAADLEKALRSRSILVGTAGRQMIRAVTHLNVSPEDTSRVCENLPDAMKQVTAEAGFRESAETW